MTTDSPVPDAAPELSPEMQAQLAALTRQAMEQLQALVAALRGVDGAIAPVVPVVPVDDGDLAGVWLPPADPVILPPGPPQLGTPVPGEMPGLSRLAVEPVEPAVVSIDMLTIDMLTIDMLSVLPPVVPAAVEMPAVAGAAPVETQVPDAWVWGDRHHAGAEGGAI